MMLLMMTGSFPFHTETAALKQSASSISFHTPFFLIPDAFNLLFFEMEIRHTEDIEIKYPQPIGQSSAARWKITTSPAFVEGKNALHVPAHAVKLMFKPGQSKVVLVGYPGLRIPLKILKKAKRRRTERYIGLGWHQFCKDLQIQAGSVVQFELFGDSKELYVSVY